MRIGSRLGVKPLFGFVDITFLHICSDPAVRTPFGVYLVCVPSTLVSDRLYRSSYRTYSSTLSENLLLCRCTRSKAFHGEDSLYGTDRSDTNVDGTHTR